MTNVKRISRDPLGRRKAEATDIFAGSFMYIYVFFPGVHDLHILRVSLSHIIGEKMYYIETCDHITSIQVGSRTAGFPPETIQTVLPL